MATTGVFVTQVALFVSFTFLCTVTVDAQNLMANSSSSNSSNSLRPKKTINLIGLLPLTSINLPSGHIVMPTLNLVLDQINSREDILPDYELKLHWEDTQCLPGPGVDALYHMLYTPPVKTMIVGDVCSVSCEPTARAAVLWNVTQMAFACSSPTLSDHASFPNFYRCAPSESGNIAVFMKLLKLYQWKKVALIHQASEYWSMFSEVIHDAMDEANYTVISSEVFLEDPALQVLNLQEHSARIIFSGFYENDALRVLCEAYKIRFYGPTILWFFFTWYTEFFWKNAPLHTDCTPDEILTVIRTNVLYVGIDDSNPDNFHTPTVGRISRAEAHAYLESIYGPDVKAREHMCNYYDAMWATALVLNRTAQTMREIGFPRGLDEFTYGDTEMTELISSSVHGLEFQGLCGPLRWTGEKSPEVVQAIKQQWEMERLSVGYLKVGSDQIEWKDGGIRWERGRPPRDSQVTIVKIVRVKNSLYTFMCSVTSVGILFSVALLGFNVHFRKRKIIKMSSPNINNVMLVGCLICYTTVFFNPTKDEVVTAQSACLTTLTTLLVGFSLMFGALFSKTWRIHVIMRSAEKSMKKVIIKDSKLIIVVLGLVLVDVLLIVIWQSIDLFTVVINIGTPEESSADPDVWIVPETTGCQSKYEMYFTAVLYGIQGIMLAFGAFLAWETRQVKLAALNDSKEIGLCIYNVLILGVMGVLINLVVDDVDVKYGFTAATIIAATALTQGIIFVPKILAVRRDDHVGVGPQSKPGTTTSTGVATVTSRGIEDRAGGSGMGGLAASIDG